MASKEIDKHHETEFLNQTPIRKDIPKKKEEEQPKAPETFPGKDPKRKIEEPPAITPSPARAPGREPVGEKYE